MKKIFLILSLFLAAGLTNFSSAQVVPPAPPNHMLRITSPVFNEGERIPIKYSCEGSNASPALEIFGIPPETVSLALIMDDPDAPAGTFTHWVVFNMKPDTTRIEENSLPAVADLGLNSANKLDYVGPCPPSGTHHYYFKVYALDKVLDLPAGASRSDVEQAMAGHIIDQGQLMGLFSR